MKIERCYKGDSEETWEVITEEKFLYHTEGKGHMKEGSAIEALVSFQEGQIVGALSPFVFFRWSKD